MVYKVVSTKLSEDEHGKLLDVCSQEGLTPSALIKESILMRIDPNYLMNRLIELMDTSTGFFQQVTDKIQQKNKEQEKPRQMTIADLKKALGIKEK